MRAFVLFLVLVLASKCSVSNRDGSNQNEMSTELMVDESNLDYIQLIGDQETKLSETSWTKGFVIDAYRILRFFEEQICNMERTNSGNSENCYLNFYTNGAKTEIIDYSAQIKLYESIDSKTLEIIWGTNSSIRSKPQALSGVNLFGPYSNYLKTVGNENSLVVDYYSSIFRSSTRSSYILDSKANYNDFDFSNVYVRLVIAIHFITENEKVNRNF